ncbi:MAG: hypothetical protein ACP5VS_07120, partial [Desulfomonilaceae bacterium]
TQVSKTDSQIDQQGPRNKKAESSGLNSATDKSDRSASSSNTSSDFNNKDKTPKRLVGAEKGKVPPESEQIKGDKPVAVKIEKADDKDWMTSVEKNPIFKKHDHLKYINRLKELAIDMLNKEANSFYAILCCDTTTDEWSLTIYNRRDNSFRYKSLVWDPIDDKWELTYESGPTPLAGWKKHASFVSSDKQCETLKGRNKK